MSYIGNKNSVALYDSYTKEQAEGNFAPITRSRKNLLINGGFDVWQRGTSFSSTSGVGFGADRWAVYADSSSTHTQDRMTFALGQTEVPGNPSYFTKITWLGSQDIIRREFRQKIENVKQFSGKRLTLSFWAKTASAHTGVLYLAFNYGGGSTTESPPFIDIDYSTVWTKHEIQIDAPDMSGKTIGNLSDSHLNLAFRFDTDVGNELSIAQAQLEEGDTATDFEHRPIGEELALCQRYYQLLYISLRSTAATTGSYHQVPVEYPVEMRSIPSKVELFNGNPTNLDTASAQLDVDGHNYPSGCGARIRSASSGDYRVLNARYGLDAEL